MVVEEEDNNNNNKQQKQKQQQGCPPEMVLVRGELLLVHKAKLLAQHSAPLDQPTTSWSSVSQTLRRMQQNNNRKTLINK